MMAFNVDDTVFDVAMRSMARVVQAGLIEKVSAVLDALGIDADVPMRQWVETGDREYHEVKQFEEAEIGNHSHTFEFKDKTRVHGEWGWVTDEAFFDDDESGIILRKTWQLVKVEERDLDRYRICETCDGEGTVGDVEDPCDDCNGGGYEPADEWTERTEV